MGQRTLKRLLLSAFCLAPALFSGTALATDSTINVSVSSSDIVIDMDSPSPSGTFKKSDNSTVSISTDNYTGYTFSISAVSDTNSSYLINDQDSNSKFTSISEATTEAEFKAFSGTSYNGLWGYLPSKLNSTSNTDFLPAPSTTGDLIDKTSAPNATANNYDIAIGARADFTMKVGDYSNHYALLVVANAIPYTIIYNDSVVTNMPVDVDSTSMTSTVTISSNTPVRDGYTFGGWCTIQVADNEACSGTTYQPGATYTLGQTGTNNLQLFAMWNGSGASGTTWANAFAAAGKSQSGGYYYIQDADASICENVAVDETISVKDKRDNEVYLIGKLKDNHCWLLDNLRLDLTTVSLANLQGNTNASNTTLGYLKNGTNPGSPYTIAAVVDASTFSYNGDAYTAAKINTASKDTINSDSAYNYGDGSHKYGIYYNFCAASAGSYCYEILQPSSDPDTSTLIDAKEDICPSNWRMPTGGPDGEYLMVASAYAGNSNNGKGDALKNALSLPLPGYYSDYGATFEGSNGYFWSSTYMDDSDMYRLDIKQTSVNLTDRGLRYYGYAVRCLISGN